MKGVMSTKVGYTGGTLKDPSYEDVATGQTGHAEVVEVEYDSSKVSYDDLLTVYWNIHDPTQLNRQEWACRRDVGPQYRSAIFFHNEEQESKAKASREKMQNSGRFDQPIVTEITRAPQFYEEKEEYLRTRDVYNRHMEKERKAAG